MKPLTKKERNSYFKSVIPHLNEILEESGKEGICVLLNRKLEKKGLSPWWSSDVPNMFLELKLFHPIKHGYWWKFNEEGDNERALSLAFMIEMSN